MVSACPVSIYDAWGLAFLGISMSTHVHLLLDILPRASLVQWWRPINILVWTCLMGFLVAFNDWTGAYMYGSGICTYRHASVWFYASQKYGYSLFLVFKAYHVMNGIIGERTRKRYLEVMGVLWFADFVIYQVYAFYWHQPFVDPESGYCIIAFTPGFTTPYFIDATICVLASGAFVVTLKRPAELSSKNARIEELRRKSIYAAFVSVAVHLAVIIYFLAFMIPMLNQPIFLIEQVIVDACMVYSNRLSQASSPPQASSASAGVATFGSVNDSSPGSPSKRKSMLVSNKRNADGSHVSMSVGTTAELRP